MTDMQSDECLLVHGLKSCDTCRKALKELKKSGIEAEISDLRESPLSPETLAVFTKNFGDRLLNRRSMTWRGLSENERDQPIEVLLSKHPTLMKRPLIESDGRMSVGWDAEARATWGL